TAQPALVTDSATTFTSTTVTAPGIGTSSAVIKKGQVIDVKDTTAGVVYSSLVLSMSGTTITIDTAWYVRDGTGSTTGTPNAGSLMIVAGFTKAWGQNTNITLNADSFATGIAGYELGLVNNKTDGSGYGFDCVSLGSKKIGNFFQARGAGIIGFVSYVGRAFGCVSFSATTAGFYSSGDNVGFSGQGNAIGVEIKAPTTYALQVVKNDNTFMTGMNPVGAWQKLRLDASSITSGGSMSSFTPFNTITPASDGAQFTMPAASSLGQVLVYIRNLHATYSVVAVGSFEGGAGTFTIAAKTTKQFWSDGNYWYPAN
ncbi:hypothetical protein, partial [Serratia sp. M24T3]|uniref:hypothetical protein n=1 Tax=Serratia sp. M24T3 TaxID=932213 RepID=UPI00025BC0CF